MRVIGGEYRSRVLKSLPGLDVRPTPDRLRETLFNVLAPRIEGVVFADLCAGTGAVGIEALSRGARRAIFVEQDRAAVGVIRANLKSLGAEGRAEVIQGKAASAAGGLQAEIVFLDPPYRLESEYEGVLRVLGDAGQKPGGRPEGLPHLVVVQHSRRLELDEAYGSLTRFRVLKQGDNWLSFYARPNSR